MYVYGHKINFYVATYLAICQNGIDARNHKNPVKISIWSLYSTAQMQVDRLARVQGLTLEYLRTNSMQDEHKMIAHAMSLRQQVQICKRIFQMLENFSQFTQK